MMTVSHITYVNQYPAAICHCQTFPPGVQILRDYINLVNNRHFAVQTKEY